MNGLHTVIMPELVTQKELCRRLGIGVQTLRDWRAAGLFPEPAVKGKWSWSAVLEWLMEMHRLECEQRHGPRAQVTKAFRRIVTRRFTVATRKRPR